MRTTQRNGVHVDQCTDCRGIFLDRGELERLVDAETSCHAGAPAATEQRPQQPGSQQHGGQPRGGQQHGGQQHGGQQPA